MIMKFRISPFFSLLRRAGRIAPLGVLRQVRKVNTRPDAKVSGILDKRSGAFGDVVAPADPLPGEEEGKYGLGGATGEAGVGGVY